MTKQDFFKLIIRRLSQVSVGASALRNQGGKGIIKKARDYFEHSIEIDDLIKNLDDEKKFKTYLNIHTKQLSRKFSSTDENWGAARKALNLFFREIVYNTFVTEHYNLPTDFTKFNIKIKYLEVPLDKYVASAIYNENENHLPKWKSIKSLKITHSDQYQLEAMEIAKKRKIARVHLDLEFWRSPDKK